MCIIFPPFLWQMIAYFAHFSRLAFITRKHDPRDHYIVICKSIPIPFYSCIVFHMCTMWIYHVGATKPLLMSIWVVSSLLLLNSAAMDRLGLYLLTFFYCNFGTDSRSEIAGLKGKCMDNFARFRQILLHWGCTILLPHQQFMRKGVSPQHVL